MHATKEPPTSYLIRRGKEIEKYAGYVKRGTYMADENLNACDCSGFTHRGECKHMMFKSLLNEFDVDELIFFGAELGECKPKTGDQISAIAEMLLKELTDHFKFDKLDIEHFIPNPADPDTCNAVEFSGSRSGGKKTLIAGYRSGIMFIVRST